MQDAARRYRVYDGRWMGDIEAKERRMTTKGVTGSVNTIVASGFFTPMEYSFIDVWNSKDVTGWFAHTSR